jgi:hypothetical protein
MNNAKYIGLDVHQATTVAAVLDGNGKLVLDAIVETKASTLLELLHGIRGELNVTLEEGTCAAWLHDVLEPHVHRVMVCDPIIRLLVDSIRREQAFEGNGAEKNQQFQAQVEPDQ